MNDDCDALGFGHADHFRACAVDLCNAIGIDPSFVRSLKVTINFEDDEVVVLSVEHTQFATKTTAEVTADVFKRVLSLSDEPGRCVAEDGQPGSG